MTRSGFLITILCLLPALASCQPSSEPDSRLPGYLDTIPIFWDELYPNGGETLYCGEAFAGNHGPVVMEVNSSPGLEGIEKASGKDVAGMIIQYIEKRLRELGERTTRSRTRGKG